VRHTLHRSLLGISEHFPLLSHDFADLGLILLGRIIEAIEQESIRRSRDAVTFFMSKGLRSQSGGELSKGNGNLEMPEGGQDMSAVSKETK
jgi:hypothetical protein